jgi:nitroreductase
MNRRYVLLGGVAAGGLGLGGAFLSMGSMSDYEAAAASARAPLPASPQARDLVRFATLAANGHNTQPWRFRVEDRQITILPDFSRRTPVVDPDDHHLFASLGCAAANLHLAGLARGFGGEVLFDPDGSGSIVVPLSPQAPQASRLFDAIPSRQSTRSVYDGSPVSTDDMKALAAAATMPGVDVAIITDRTQLARLRDLVIAGNTTQMADPAFVAELKAWIRFNPAAALARGDGLFSASSGNPTLPTWPGTLLFDLVFRAGPENDKYARQIDSSSGVAVISGLRDDRAHWMRAGYAGQRFCLQATALGLRTSFPNQPGEVPALRVDLAALAGLPGRRPDLVVRFGRAPALPWSPRRPAANVMVTAA